MVSMLGNLRQSRGWSEKQGRQKRKMANLFSPGAIGLYRATDLCGVKSFSPRGEKLPPVE
jgi:hypothetical protein